MKWQYKIQEIHSFIADAMLGKIARKLRILGFDTIYIRDIEDNEILDLLFQTERILLTADKELFYRSKKYNLLSIFLNKNTEIENLVTIFRYLNIKHINLNSNYYRCSICNNKLMLIENPDAIKKEIHQKIFANNKIFFICYECNKLYWCGTHIKKISLLIERINNILNLNDF
jgi:uncharacterized protein